MKTKEKQRTKAKKTTKETKKESVIVWNLQSKIPLFSSPVPHAFIQCVIFF